MFKLFYAKYVAKIMVNENIIKHGDAIAAYTRYMYIFVIDYANNSVRLFVPEKTGGYIMGIKDYE